MRGILFLAVIAALALGGLFGGAEWAGFIAMMLAGTLLLAAGFLFGFFSKGFTGSIFGHGGSDTIIVLGFLGGGALFVYLAVATAPFEIVIR
jgi:hypothetical protein